MKDTIQLAPYLSLMQRFRLGKLGVNQLSKLYFFGGVSGLMAIA
ncbi:MAG: hypothetical protein AAGF98_07305 [Cyanobacteria bacterium P01_H01_bin.153]